MSTTAATNLPADPATATPVEIDTALAGLHREMERPLHTSVHAARALSDYRRREAGIPTKDRYGRRVEAEPLSEYETGYEIPRLEAEHAKATAEVARLWELVLPLAAQYAACPWARYYLVQNNNGHVHSSMNCSTCFGTTQYGWLYELSGQPAADVIDEWGEKACTVCFPDAPTFPRFSEPSRQDLAAKAAREAEKAARDAKKAEKNLTPAQRFQDRNGWWIETVAACKTAIRDAVEAERYYPNSVDEYRAVAAQARAVLLERGVTEAELDLIVERKRKALARG